MAGRLGLVLSGGGAPAAYFGVGVAQAIAEAGLKPTVYSGVSAGALNAGALSTGIDPRELADTWRSTGTLEIVRPRLDVWNLLVPRAILRHPVPLPDRLLDAIGWTWTLHTTPARKLLTRILHGEQVVVPDGTTLVVSAVDQGSAEVVRFANRLPPQHRRSDGGSSEFHETTLTVDHLLASAAVPLLFPASKFNDLPGREFTDAGLVANTPLKPALAYEPDAVVVVSASGIKRPAPLPGSLGAAIGLLAENVAYFALLADYKHAQTVNALVQADAGKGKKQVELLLVEPHNVSFSAPAFLRFDREAADRVIALGVEQGHAALKGWKGLDRL